MKYAREPAQANPWNRTYIADDIDGRDLPARAGHRRSKLNGTRPAVNLSGTRTVKGRASGESVSHQRGKAGEQPAANSQVHRTEIRDHFLILSFFVLT